MSPFIQLGVVVWLAFGLAMIEEAWARKLWVFNPLLRMYWKRRVQQWLKIRRSRLASRLNRTFSGFTIVSRS